jgi:hypothetical protein
MHRVEFNQDKNQVLKSLVLVNSSKALPSMHNFSLTEQKEQTGLQPDIYLSSIKIRQKNFAGLDSNSLHKQPLDSKRAKRAAYSVEVSPEGKNQYDREI